MVLLPNLVISRSQVAKEAAILYPKARDFEIPILSKEPPTEVGPRNRVERVD